MSLFEENDLDVFKEKATKLNTKRLLSFYKKKFHSFDEHQTISLEDADSSYVKRLVMIKQKKEIIKELLDEREHVLK